MPEKLPPSPVPPPLRELFLGFLSVGVYGFGGVLPWARRMIVEQRRWLSPAEFNDMLALCQFLPGPNIINLSAALGYRWYGWAGAVTCFTGLMFAPMVIIILLGMGYARIGGHPSVQHAFSGLSAAASAMVIATSLKIAAPLLRRPYALVIVAITFVAAAVLRVPLLYVVIACAPLSILLLAQVEK
jgi:chromate transporter